MFSNHEAVLCHCWQVISPFFQNNMHLHPPKSLVALFHRHQPPQKKECLDSNNQGIRNFEKSFPTNIPLKNQFTWPWPHGVWSLTGPGCWEIHTDSWLKFTPTIQTKKTCWKNQYLKSNKSPVFWAFFEWMIMFIFLTVGCVPWNGRDTWKSNNPHYLPLITPIQVGCFNKQHTGVRRRIHIYIYIFIVCTYHVYMYTRLYVIYIYINIRWDVPLLKTYGNCMIYVIIAGLRPHAMSNCPGAAVNSRVRPRTTTGQLVQVYPGTATVEKNGGHGELPSQTMQY